MAITKYTGQALAPGAIILRRSVMTNGICARPVIVSKTSGTRVYVKEPGAVVEELRPTYTKTIEYVADTLEEAIVFARASGDFLQDERKHYDTYLKELGERRRTVIATYVKES